MLRTAFRLVLGLAAVAAAVIGAAVGAQDLYIANARILDVSARAERIGNVLIADGVLAGFPATKPPGFKSREIDAGRRWVMPAFPMVTGTDAGNPGAFQGYSVHRELRLLVAAGVPAWDALAATTINAGRLLGRGWGMAVGDEGTLVILDASPLDDIASTERIATIVLRGAVVDRGALLAAEPGP